MRRTLTIGMLLLLAGCGPNDGDSLELPEFPAEPIAAEFPGKSYPLHEGPLPRPRRQDGPVWLIGIDGATWDLIRPGIERGELPAFGRLVAEGAHGVMLSEEPMISPALWATIATGMPRFKHGILDFTVKLPGSYESVTVGPLDRRSPAVWEHVGAAGGRAAVVSWFGSFPAEKIAGYYVSKGTKLAEAKPFQVHPDSLAAALAQRGEPEIHPAWQERIARTPYLARTLYEDLRTLEIWRTILEFEPVDFLALYLSGIDVVQHVTWRHMDPASRAFPQDGEPEPTLAGVIPAYYEFVDAALSEIVAAAPEGTTIVVVSDHGGGPMRPEEAFHLQLEVLLQSMGLMQGKQGSVFAISELYRYDKRIWLNLAGVEPSGPIPPADAGRRTRQLAGRLAAMRTGNGEPLFVSIVNHVAEPGWRAGDPALTVRFSVAALLASEVYDGDTRIDFDPVRLRHTDVSGGHLPEGILVLHGPGIRPGALPTAASLYHIAPTLLYLLGLPQDARMMRFAPAGGGVLEAAFRQEFLEQHPIRMIAEYPGTDRRNRVRASTDDGEIDPAREEALEKLRSLGYIR